MNDKEMALLKNRLQMPLIVRDLLITNQTPSADENYALHEMLGNFTSDEALLCSAFVMKEIADFDKSVSTDLAFLHMECDRLIERYSARADLAKENPEIWNETQNAMLNTIFEDMEDFLELIELCHMSYEVTNPRITKFLDIITAQLQSHLMIIDEAILARQKITDKTDISQPYVTGFAADNVIMFPG